jgi:hypothetical protein
VGALGGRGVYFKILLSRCHFLGDGYVVAYIDPQELKIGFGTGGSDGTSKWIL